MRRLVPGMIEIGLPIPMNIYTHDGRLLRRAGSLIKHSDLYQELINVGYIADDAAIGEVPAFDEVEQAKRISATRILVVDDSELFVELLERNLRHIGLGRIASVRSGRDAIAWVSNKPVDLIFLDIEMPDIDGLATLEAIHKIRPDLFVCMLSAHSSVANVRKAIATGAAAFVVKPCQTSRLRYILDQYLRQKPVESTAAAATSAPPVATETG